MASTKEKVKIVCDNRKARHEYNFLEVFEAGIELKGTEVKSLRAGKGNLQDAYAKIEDGQMILSVSYTHLIFISHADNQEAAEKLADIVREKPGVKEVRIGWISPVIGAHCGAGTLAIFFMADNR